MLQPIIMMLELLASAYNLPKEEVYCMAEAIYFEARGEEYIGQIAVGNVMNNRAKSPLFPDTICKVVHQGKQYLGYMIIHRCQFSYYCDGKLERIRSIIPFVVAVKATIAVLAKNNIVVKDAVYYHTIDVQPKWAKEKIFITRVGQHLFYK